MARGRIIVSDITRDKRINNLSCDTSRLAFTWLVTFADRAGRTHGDPALVRSMLFPRRTDITTEHVAGFLREWHDCGLAIWYEGDDDLWVQFPSFLKHQKGFDRRHEPDSVIPDPPATPDIDNGGCTDNVQTRYVQSTAEVEVEVEVEVEGKVNTAPAQAPPTTPTKPKPKVKPKSPPPPAIAAFREAAQRFPSKAVWSLITDAVGDGDADLERWRQVVTRWIGMGWKPDNVNGMLEHFKAHRLPGDDNGHNRKSTSTSTFFGNCPRPEWKRADPALFKAGSGDSQGT